MPLSGYPYHPTGGGKKAEYPLKKEHKYTFKNSLNIQYIVNVEEYKYDVYVIKFHLKNHKQCPIKYSIVFCKSKLFKNIIKNKHKKYAYIEARKVLNTCINIGHDIYAKNPLASFGFIGMPTVDGNSIEPLKETKRYKVYEKLAKFHFKPENFEHRRNRDKSLYLLLNRKKIQQNNVIFDEIMSMFVKTYDVDEMYANLLLADGE